eukprot:47454_1
MCLPVQDHVGSSKAISALCKKVVDIEHDGENIRMDMIMPFSFNDDLAEVEKSGCCTEMHEDAKTAELSISSGETFAPANLRALILAVDADQALAKRKADCSQRGILRGESRISEPQEKPSHKRERKIRFGTVSVRNYGRILGDHPCCSYGPPLSIDWEYHQHEPLDVNVYESENISTRKTMRQLALNYYQRKYLLSDYSESDFKAVKKEVKRVKSNRYITRRLACFHPVEAALESACRKLKRLPKIREEES